MSLEWKMNSSQYFIADSDDYRMIAYKNALGWYWKILKDNILIDEAVYHPHTPSSELDAKVKCEKEFNSIKDTTLTNK